MYVIVNLSSFRNFHTDTYKATNNNLCNIQIQKFYVLSYVRSADVRANVRRRLCHSNYSIKRQLRTIDDSDCEPQT